jgi:hypothetical protein
MQVYIQITMPHTGGCRSIPIPQKFMFSEELNSQMLKHTSDVATAWKLIATQKGF